LVASYLSDTPTGQVNWATQITIVKYNTDPISKANANPDPYQKFCRPVGV